jgi:transcriptional regulator with XRE-family HTH domain
MKITVRTVEDVGQALRAVRKDSRIRIDDFAALSAVSKQFVSDVEAGKPTVQMGKVLSLLAGMGLTLTMDLPDTAHASLERLRAGRSRRPAHDDA